MSTKANQAWLDAYQQAALEVDTEKMPARLGAARRAVNGRLRDLQGDRNHYAERRQMDAALAALIRLEKEARSW